MCNGYFFMVLGFRMGACFGLGYVMSVLGLCMGDLWLGGWVCYLL